MENFSQNNILEVNKIIDDIIKGINLGETMVFCGAGISMNSGLPIVSQLVPYILDKLEVTEDTRILITDNFNNPKIPFEAFMEVVIRNSISDRIMDIYNQGEPNANHILIAKLIKAGKIKTIVTTNFDKLIEKALSMEPIALCEGKDYDLIYKEQDFENINWLDNRIRIIKIHGSIDDRNEIAITLKRVSRKFFSIPSKIIIEQMFSKGPHGNVIILGYSSSDIFDINPHIESIGKSNKKVYYIQHASIQKVENIKELNYKNPFKFFGFGKRIYIDTDDFIEKIWGSILEKDDPYNKIKNEINWRENIDEWLKLMLDKGFEIIKYFIPANILFQLGNFQEALINYKLALKIALECEDKLNEKNSLANIGCTQIFLGNFKEAIEYLKQALNKTNEDTDKEIINYLNNIGVAYKDIGEYKEAIESYERAISISRKHKDIESEATSLSNLGLVYLKRGQYDQSILYNEQALEINVKFGNKHNEGLNLLNIGASYNLLGKYNTAIEFIEKAIDVAVKLGDKISEGNCYGSLGNAYNGLDKHEKAIEYFELNLKIAHNKNLKQNECTCLCNIGSAYGRMKKFEKSLEYFKNALLIAIEIGDKPNEGICHGNLGNVFLRLNQYEKAIKCFEKALRIAQDIGELYNEGSCLGNLGNVYLKKGEYFKAIEHYNYAISVITPLVGRYHSDVQKLEYNLNVAKANVR